MQIPNSLFTSSLSVSTLAHWKLSLVSTGCKATADGLTAAQHAISEVRIPDRLTTLVSETKQLTLEGSARTYQFCIDSPGTAAACGAIGVGLLVVASPGIIAAPALTATGFGANGIIAGSTAAGVHSAIGNVAASGAFAVLQSAGAGGYGLAAVHGGIQLAGSVTAVSGAVALSKTEATP
ncbi:hypothetical protein LY76DRAFT_521478 [Colletotrichum caudatum]|nr:hypothetical protein LY76DRAFT_521478 [Colletotrichum caudatum]